MKRNTKGMLSMLLIMVMVFSQMGMVSAEEITVISQKVNDDLGTKAYWETWRVKSTSYSGISYGPYKYLTTLGPANATGESFSVSESINVGVSINGSLSVSKSALTTALGFDVSADVGVSITKNSRALQKGESIKVDYRFKEHKYDVAQIKEIHLDGQVVDGITTNIIVVKPDPFADIRFTYISANNIPYRIEESKSTDNGKLMLISENNLWIIELLHFKL